MPNLRVSSYLFIVIRILMFILIFFRSDIFLYGQLLPNPVRRWTVEDGLPSNNISIFFQDSRHYLWIGTLNGLCRFNGREFEQFSDDALLKNSFAGNFVKSIIEDDAGRVYIVNNETGISRYDYHAPEKGFETILPGTAFSKLKGLSPQTYFIKADSAHLFLYYDDTIRKIDLHEKKMNIVDPLARYPELAGFKFKYMRPINRSGGKITGLDPALGAVVFDVESGDIVFRTPPEVNAEIVKLNGMTRFNNLNPYLLIFGEYGRYWLFNWVSGTLVDDGMIPLPPGRALLTGGPMSDGTFCYIYDRESVFIFDPKSHAAKNCQFLLISRDSVNTTFRGFHEMPDGYCYVATNGGVIMWDYRNHEIENFKIPSSLSGYDGVPAITSFASFPGEPFVIGNVTGIYTYDEAKNVFQHFNNESSTDTQGFLFNYKSQLILGQHGLTEIDISKKTSHSLTVKGSSVDLYNFQHSVVSAVLSDSTSGNSCFWIGTSNQGLFKWNTHNHELHHISLITSQGDTVTNIQSLAIDRFGRVVVASLKFGLFFIQPVQEKVMIHLGMDQAIHPHLPDGRLMSVITDHLDQLWLVMQSIGLVKLDWDTCGQPLFSIYGSSYGLTNTILYSGLPDQHGNIWIGSESGIEKWDKDYQRFFHFGPEHGIIENQFRKPVWIDHDGRFYFASTNTFIRFHPDSLQINTMPPPITVRSIQVNAIYRPDLINNDQIQLKAKEKNVVIRFDVIEFRNPKRTMFRYRINEKGKTLTPWTYSQQTEISLPNLAAGNYEIAYNAANENGFWHDKDYLMMIHLPKLWYTTTWFYISCVLVMGIIGYSLYRYRIRQFKHVIALRNRISRDLHDDVGSSLGSISIYSEVLRNLEGKQKEEVLNKVGETSREMLEKLNDLVWNINPANDKMEKIESRMRGFAAMILNPLGIQFDIVMDPGLKESHLEMEKRRNLFLIFKEAVHNAAKYSNCRNIIIRLEEDKGKWKMAIEDNGKGFDITAIKTYNGNGLKSMEERALAMKGQLIIESHPENGTRIVVDQF